MQHVQCSFFLSLLHHISDTCNALPQLSVSPLLSFLLSKTMDRSSSHVSVMQTPQKENRNCRTQNKLHLISLCSCKYSAVGITTTYRLDNQGNAVEQEVLLSSINVQTDSGVHPASCLMDKWGLSLWVKWPDVKLTAHFHPLTRLKMCGAISSPSTCHHDMHGNFTFVFFCKKAYIWQQTALRWYIYIYTTNYWNFNWQTIHAMLFE